MQIKKFNLKNGLKVILINIHGSMACSTNFYLPAGYKYDPKDRPGLAHLAEHMMLAGTKKYPSSKDLDAATTRFGGLQTAFTWIDYQLHTVRVPKNKIQEGLEVLSETAFNPLLKEDELKKEKQSVIEEINKGKAEPDISVWDYAWNGAFWKGTQLARAYTGTAENLDSISIEDIRTFVDTVPFTKGVLCLSGNINYHNILNLLEKYFGDKIDTKRDSPPKIIPGAGGSLNVIPSSNENVYLMFGFRTVGNGHVDTYRLHLIGRLLGGSFSGFLVDRLREKGLIYDWILDQDILQETGYLYFKTSTNKRTFFNTIKMICEAFKKVSEEKISKENFEIAQGQTFGELSLNLETTIDYCKWFGRQEFLGGRSITPKEAIGIYKGITIGSLKEVARKHFTNKNWYLGIVGDIDEEKTRRLIETSLPS